MKCPGEIKVWESVLQYSGVTEDLILIISTKWPIPICPPVVTPNSLLPASDWMFHLGSRHSLVLPPHFLVTVFCLCEIQLPSSLFAQCPCALEKLISMH